MHLQLHPSAAGLGALDFVAAVVALDLDGGVACGLRFLVRLADAHPAGVADAAAIVVVGESRAGPGEREEGDGSE